MRSTTPSAASRSSDGGHAHPFTASMGDSADVACHCWAGLSLWFLGRPDQALGDAEAALAIARSAAHVHAEATAHAYAAMLAQLRNEPERTRELAGRRRSRTACAPGTRTARRIGLVLRGWARAAEGDHDGLARCSTASRSPTPWARGWIARTSSACSPRCTCCATSWTEARTVAGRCVRRDAGAPLLLRGRAAPPVRRAAAPGRRARRGPAALAYAVELARAKASPALELRAGLALGALLLEEGRPTEADALVRRPFEMFTEGYDTPDLRGAAAFLDAISAID